MRTVDMTMTEPTHLRSMFLSQYFLADVLFSRFCAEEEMRDIFDKYADVFCIADSVWLNEVWAVISSDLFALADNTADFNRLFRLAKQYPEQLSELEEHVLTLKANGIQTKAEVLATCEDVPFDTLLHTLERRANGGDTDCIALVGFLEHHGIFFSQNTERAKKRLKTAALWDHPFAVLMGAKYTSTPVFFHKKLCAILYGSSTDEVTQYLTEALSMSPDLAPDRVAMALEHAFCQGALHPCKINTDVMKVMCSVVLNENEKYKLIKSAKEKESFSPEIPLNVSHSTEFTVDADKLTASSPSRARELALLKTNLSMIDLRATSIYRPLLITCEDELVRDLYREMIKGGFSSAPIVEATLSDLDKNVFAHSDENIFLSAMEKSRDRNVVLLIEHCELLSHEGALELASYLKGTRRKHYKTATTPAAEIDLSGVLPILFSAEPPDASILECCDVIYASELSRDEFRAVLEKELERKRSEFMLSSLTMETDVPELLYEYSSETVMALIGQAIALGRQTMADVRLTVPMLKDIITGYYKNAERNDFWRNTNV